MIISFLVKSVIKMDAKSVVNASSLRDLYDTFMNRTRALEALGEDPMSHGCILLPLFETKLPPQLLEKWELTLADTQEDEIGLELFFKFLNRQVVSKEAGERSSNGNITPGNHSSDKSKENLRKSSSPKMGGENEMYTASALLGETRPPTQPNCNFCKADHDSQNCPMFNEKSLDGRWKLVQENKLCFNCLKPSNHKHFSRICRHPKCSVANCGHRHHWLLHGQQSVVTPRHLSNTSLSGLASTKPALPMRETLLQTALARLIVKGQEMTVRVLLDSGSQRSYIRKNIAEALDLQGPSELLSVTTLGGETSETKRFQRVKFTLSPIKGDSKVEIEALSISKICNPLGPVQMDFHKNSHLQGLTLADSYPRGSV